MAQLSDPDPLGGAFADALALAETTRRLVMVVQEHQVAAR
jgi:hypothetical protein